MRCITRIVLLCVLAPALPAVLAAQHGFASGGHAGAPAAHGAYSAGGYAGAGRAGTTPFGLRSVPFVGYTGIQPGALNSHGYYGRDFGRREFRGRDFRGRDFRRVPYEYFFAPYYYPSLDYTNSAYADYGPGFDPGAGPDAQGAMMAQNMLGEQINRLSAEVEQLKYGQQAPPPALATREDSQPPPPPVTVVLRNGQQIKVQDYAVMNQTFWDFSSQPTRKIPIANIDVAASAKATAAGGGEFPQLDTESHNSQ